MAHPQCLVRCDPHVYEILFDEIKRDELLNRVFYHINPSGKIVDNFFLNVNYAWVKG